MLHWKYRFKRIQRHPGNIYWKHDCQWRVSKLLVSLALAAVVVASVGLPWISYDIYIPAVLRCDSAQQRIFR